MQVMCIEFARHVLDYEDANSSEFNENTPYPIINLMLEQHDVTDMGGTMRLGAYPCDLQANSLAARIYNQEKIEERHRHRFEFNNDYREKFQENGMSLSGLSPDNLLVEIVELDDHPYMIGSQFHPEFLSRPNQAHPLFLGLIQASVEYKQSKAAETQAD
jgi:CTP synthase